MPLKLQTPDIDRDDGRSGIAVEEENDFEDSEARVPDQCDL